jgi:hypothetical protein
MRIARVIRLPFLPPLLAAALAQTGFAEVVYVNDDAPGMNDGSSWEDAFVDLQDALAAAATGDEIWVAEGTYEPTPDTDRTAAFHLVNGVGLYGGFAGTETQRSQRDWSLHPSILSGDLGVAGVGTDNSCHVIDANGTGSSAVLDGFTVTAGRADCEGSNGGRGGGLLCVSGSPTIQNTRFEANHAHGGGGGSTARSWTILPISGGPPDSRPLVRCPCSTCCSREISPMADTWRAPCG